MHDEEAESADREGPDFVTSGPLLPPDDRLWRHPSELGNVPLASVRGPSRLSSASSPTRAGVLSAGLAGAMLAAGLVLLGTHLATAFSSPSTATPLSVTAGDFATTTSVEVNPFQKATIVGTALEAIIQRVGAATVVVSARRGRRATRGTGLVIESQCVVITSYELVDGATSLTLTLPDGTQANAQLIGDDPETGIAVLRCPATQLATIGAVQSEQVTDEEMVAVTTPNLAFGVVRDPDEPLAVPGASLLDEIKTDLKATSDGSALIGNGGVVGLVVGSSGGAAVATPTWLAMAAAHQIVASGKVETGVLGIKGERATSSVPGVQVVSVSPRSAAAQAGIRSGDVIESVDGARTTTMSSLEARLHCLTPGTPVSISLRRDGHDMHAKAVLVQAPAAA